MTSLLFTLTIIALFSLCILIGKYNKNDELAMRLTIALLLGLAGGAIVNKLVAEGKKKNSLTQVVSSTQMLTVNEGVDIFTIPSCPVDDSPKFVMKNINVPARDSKMFAPSKRNGEIRAQPFAPPTTRGGPIKFFDTS